MVQKRGGVLLREWLDEERRTQEWLAEQIGTHQTNVSAWIRGRPIPLAMAIAIRDVTKIDVEEWTRETESGSLPSTDAAKTA